MPELFGTELQRLFGADPFIPGQLQGCHPTDCSADQRPDGQRQQRQEQHIYRVRPAHPANAHQELSYMLEKLGGKIEEEMSAKTDFVVLGEGFRDHPVYKRATERGIEMILESEFLNYLEE